MTGLTNEIGIPKDPEGPLVEGSPDHKVWRKRLHYIFAALADNILNVEQPQPQNRVYSVKVILAQVKNALRL